MTKKETELQTRLLDLLEANTQALAGITELLAKLANPPILVAPIERDPQPGSVVYTSDPKPADPEENKQETKTDITPEYCRKALKAISTRIGNDDAKKFLARFGKATTIPQLEEKYYEDFIAEATKIMEDH